MLLSTRARYGVRAMFQLATRWGQGPVSLRTVAQEQDLSLAYLEQLVGVLRRCGLVESVRGRHGGYQLASPPERITVGDIIRALEGPVFVSACADPDPDFEECGRGDFCVSRLLWMKVHKQIEEAFDSATLADLCEAAQCSRDEARRVLMED